MRIEGRGLHSASLLCILFVCRRFAVTPERSRKQMPTTTEILFDEIEIEALTDGIRMGSVEHSDAHTDAMGNFSDIFCPGSNFIRVVDSDV